VFLDYCIRTAAAPRLQFFIPCNVNLRQNTALCLMRTTGLLQPTSAKDTTNCPTSPLSPDSRYLHDPILKQQPEYYILSTLDSPSSPYESNQPPRSPPSIPVNANTLVGQYLGLSLHLPRESSEPSRLPDLCSQVGEDLVQCLICAPRAAAVLPCAYIQSTSDRNAREPTATDCSIPNIPDF
jgi:hypothetical protein